MTHWTSIVFYIVFLGQVLLTSGYLARRTERRLLHVLDNFPASQYPKLYPRPAAYYRRGYARFRLANRIILALGFVVLIGVMFVIDHAQFAEDGYISEVFPAVYGLLQFLPFMVLELSQCSQLKLMRNSGASAVRRASLVRRGLFDVMSPALFAAALACLGGAILVDLFVHDFVISLGHDTMQRAITLLVTNLLLAVVGGISVYGRKRNPHQSGDDYFRKLRASLSSLAFVSIALSVFTALRAAGDAIDMAAVEATLVSLYFQGIVLLSLGYTLKSLRIEDMNFEVYRNGAAMS